MLGVHVYFPVTEGFKISKRLTKGPLYFIWRLKEGKLLGLIKEIWDPGPRKTRPMFSINPTGPTMGEPGGWQPSGGLGPWRNSSLLGSGAWGHFSQALCPSPSGLEQRGPTLGGSIQAWLQVPCCLLGPQPWWGLLSSQPAPPGWDTCGGTRP